MIRFSGFLKECMKRKENYILLLLVCIASTIKLFNFDYFVTYHFEIAQHYLQIIKLNDGQFLLEGPFSTHSWFRFSAAPYYLFYPFFMISGFHPLLLSNMWAVISVCLVFFIYSVVKSMYDKETGLLASIFYLISTNILLMDRHTAFFAFVIPLSVWLFHETYKFYFLNKGKLWLIFFIISCMTTLHPAAYMLLPFYIVITFFYKNYFTKKELKQTIIGFFIPQIPLILNEIFRKFSTIISFTLWIPYKLVQFITGKTLGTEKTSIADTSIENIFNFLTQSVLPPFIPYWVSIIVFLGMILYLLYSLKKKKWSIDVFFVLLLVYGLTVLFIHKNPPPHYFVPIILAPIIIFSRMLRWLYKKEKYKIPILCTVIAVVFLNVFFIITQYLFVTKEHPYKEQLEVAKKIIEDANGQHYRLERIGDFDTYNLQAKENYIYLLWWLGNRPTTDAALTYTIVEDKDRLSEAQATKIVDVVENIVILKN